MAERHDVLVVGAGPAGAAAALTAARLGLGSVLLLDKAPAGRPKTCAGGLSPRARRALRGLGVWDAVAAEAMPVFGLRLTSRNGREVTLAGAETASVLARSRLDALLAGAAVRAGADFTPGARVDGLLREDGRVIGVRCGDREILARWTVLACGAVGHVLAGRPPRALLHGLMGWWDGVPHRPGILEMFFDTDIWPHYAWLFPESPTRVNVGLCVRTDRLAGVSIRVLFQRLIDRYLRERLSGAVQVGPWRGHPIAASVRVEHRAPPGLLLAGEAAGLANVATGEGISYALDSGILVAEAISAADRAGWDAVRAGACYADALRRRFTVPFRVADLFQRYGVVALDGITSLGSMPWVRWVGRHALARV